MASESSFIERLINSRNRDLSLFLPFMLGFTNIRPEPDPDQDSENPDQETPDRTQSGSARDRIILINPMTQGMVVIEGSSSGFDSLLRDLMRKDGQPPASKASIDAMPTVEIESAGGECAICLEDWGVGDVAREMPCKHKFHGGCVEKWLKIHGSCPVCRYKMPVDDDFDDKKINNGEESERRRREIWVTFAFNGGERSNEEEQRSTDQEESIDSFSL